MKNLSNTPGHLMVLAFLFSLATGNFLSTSLQAQITRDANSSTSVKNEITVMPYELFNRQYAGGAGGIYEFVNNTTPQKQGFCNFDRGSLSTNEAFVFHKVSIGYSTAAISKAGAVDYKTLPPAALRNAEFEITQGGRTVLNMPVAAFINPTGSGESQADQWTEVGNLRYLQDEKSFTWSIKFPDGESLTAGSTGNTDYAYIEVRLGGFVTQKNS